jgi:hypothetical protein
MISFDRKLLATGVQILANCSITLRFSASRAARITFEIRTGLRRTFNLMKTGFGRVEVIIGDIGDIGEGEDTSQTFRKSLLML